MSEVRFYIHCKLLGEADKGNKCGDIKGLTRNGNVLYIDKNKVAVWGQCKIISNF